MRHPIDGGTYTRLKVVQFLGDLGQTGQPRPLVWKNKNYPQGVSGDRYHKIPDEDLRYITVSYEVLRRAGAAQQAEAARAGTNVEDSLT